MIEALVLQGMTAKEVCEEFGISASRLSVLRKTKAWKDEENILNERFRDECFSKN